MKKDFLSSNFLFLLSIGAFYLLTTSSSCKKDDDCMGPSQCFNSEEVEFFLFTEVQGEVVGALSQEKIITSCEIDADCRLDVKGNAKGINSQSCKFIYPLIKPTKTSGWYVQSKATINPDDSWDGQVQLGSKDNPAIGDDFLMIAVATGDTLPSDLLIIEDLDLTLPIGYKRTLNIITMKVR